nr:MAG TPA: hypothetical protein [Caudoviricetes sp.]
MSWGFIMYLGVFIGTRRLERYSSSPVLTPA